MSDPVGAKLGIYRRGDDLSHIDISCILLVNYIVTSSKLPFLSDYRSLLCKDAKGTKNSWGKHAANWQERSVGHFPHAYALPINLTPNQRPHANVLSH